MKIQTKDFCVVVSHLPGVGHHLHTTHEISRVKPLCLLLGIWEVSEKKFSWRLWKF